MGCLFMLYQDFIINVINGLYNQTCVFVCVCVMCDSVSQ